MASHTEPAVDVLVLMATYNGAAWLDEQLQTIWTQAYVRVSVVVSDDGSTDGTRGVIERARLAGNPISVLPTRGPGQGACANFLRLIRDAEFAGADFVALADQDDKWLPQHLNRAVQSLTLTECVAYSCDAVAFWPDGRQRRLGKAFPQTAFDHLFEPAGPGCTYVFTGGFARALQAELRQQPGRFDGIGYHDWLIYAFARTHGLRWFIDPEPGVLYRQHSHNELGANIGFSGVGRRWHRLTSSWFRQQVLRIAHLWPGAHDEVGRRLKRLTWADRFWIARHSRQMRRRPRDQLALAVMILVAVLR